MENASKALLIAGAVLIVILLIAVGMMIYNGARGTVDESIAQMSTQQIQAFNDQFTQLGNTRVAGSTVTSLEQKVEANNLQNPGAAGNTPKNILWTNNAGNINASSLYDIQYVKDANTGLIKEIRIYTLSNRPGNAIVTE